MLTGEKVRLRARRVSDAPILGVAMNDDVETAIRADGDPWRPRSLDEVEARYRKWAEEDPDPKFVSFAVEELATDELAGGAVLWGIDTHNRNAHLGYQLLPSFRGRGLGTDLIRVLCDYGFRIRGLHRLQIESTSDNEASLRAAQKVGFVIEGQLRQSGWVGEFVDETILGMLATEWARK